ncbi:S-4TM family putative pore-forming effector [Sinorhizobium numidicum]|uniref:S-4TM family putative pore-forming effector n=1 Tax=Sinorhizobium numidicum TaxID=680248 RepID=A0ABY8D176_9HYPH|nr:S-4TM family putative pore-forming effector [Sinorhizobium numidicum]WEX77950.1 S-4TM family putative pore-forming effector [Sinorhizobium numidicum]WEX84609.1 S-4TM family putative pore-forming effector [Sinorhizobium numidicum]
MVPERQNTEHALKLMKARHQVWYQAKQLLISQIILTVALPILAAFANIAYPILKPYTSAVAIAVSVADVGILDRWYRSLLKRAARIAEDFDTYVLDLPWNKFLVGPKLDSKLIDKEASAFDKRSDDRKLRDWYPQIFSTVPTHIGRLMCQRTNLWYDAKLRKMYAYVMLLVVVFLVATLVLIAHRAEMDMGDFVLTFLAPISPLLLWTMREFVRQRDTAAGQDQAREESEDLWKHAAKGEHNCAHAERLARELQDSIYSRRSATPLVFPGLYRLMRARLETQMETGSASLIAEYRAIEDAVRV